MNAITSAAAFFRAAQGKSIRKTVTGVDTIETWEERKADIIRQLREQGCEDIREDDKALMFGNQFIMKPKLRAEEVGELLIRSADYGFVSANYPKPVWGDKKGAKMEGGRLVKEYPNGMKVAFEILE